MLRDGKFIKEPPIVIGAHYVWQYHIDKEVSEEEEIMQSVLLEEKIQPEISVEKCLLYIFLTFIAFNIVVYLIV